jgi:hypothetical protein
MAAQRRDGRLMGVAVIAGPLLLAGVAWAGPAQADTTPYLNDLHNVGIGDDRGGDAALLQMGQKVCVEAGYGASTGQLVALALQRSDTDQGARGLNPSGPTSSLTTP